MNTIDDRRPIHSLALVGGGPAALFMCKRLCEDHGNITTLHIFERHERLGVGMPYGRHGAEKEHMANVSANELPALIEDFETYISKHPPADFPEIRAGEDFNEFAVIPRRLLGDYLEYCFTLYLGQLRRKEVEVHVHLETAVSDIIPQKQGGYQLLHAEEKTAVDAVVMCTGHHWPKKHEDKVAGWYDSPYPPSKFDFPTNYPCAVRGASLTAVDAIKSLARQNGFYEEKDGHLVYHLDPNSPNFRIDLYSLRGFLPALRFHTEDDAFSADWTMSLDEIFEYKKNHGGFVDLDYVFERNFKRPVREKDPEFYEKIKDLTVEEFVEEMLALRKKLDSFLLLKAEYQEAEKSIHRHQSIVWKETLAAFSYAMNYPAKHFPAEDMLRLRKKLMPLISIIIASLPQSSYEEMMALYNAGLLTSNAVGPESYIEPAGERGAIYHIIDEDGTENEVFYDLYVDAVGQQALEFNDLPFDGLKRGGEVSTGFLYFKNQDEGARLMADGDPLVKQNSNGDYYLQVKGLGINDYFQALDRYAVANPNLFLMAVPYIGGLNPDYSGMDFCDTASAKIIQKLTDNDTI